MRCQLILGIATFVCLAAAQDVTSACNLKITGFSNAKINSAPFSYIGNTSDSKSSKVYFSYWNKDDPEIDPGILHLKFDFQASYWTISSEFTGTIARCRSAACLNAMDLGSLGTSGEWEERATASEDFQPTASPVQVGCCPHKPNPCHSCDINDCAKYQTFSSCTKAKLGGSCCSPKWNSGFVCSCPDTAYQCLPYKASEAILV